MIHSFLNQNVWFEKKNSRGIFRLAFLSLCILTILTLFTPSIQAQSTDELEKQLREKQEQIKQLEKQLAVTQAQEKTLNSQLQFIDGQTKLTELKIQETVFQVTKLTKEITDLDGRITRLSNTVDQISELLLTRIIKTYKYSNYSTLDLIFSSQGFADLIERVKYLQVVQTNDKKVLYQLQATKATYNDQKQDKQTRQAQQEKLKKDLEKYQAQLTEQKKAKEELLRVTKNDETKFQELLSRLRADSESIARALAGAGVKLGSVKKGERIAAVGSSGCSTGPHLHLEVMTPAKIVEQGGKYFIEGKDNKVDPLPYIQSGQFPKPTASYSGNDCSQGGTCRQGDITTRFKQWYNVLGGSYHTGLDVADYFGASIYAASDGVSYAFTDSRACPLTGTVGKGLVVDHQNGVVTLYWHLP